MSTPHVSSATSDGGFELPSSESVTLPLPEEQPTDETALRHFLLLYGAFTQGIGHGLRSWIALAFAGYCATGSLALGAIWTMIGLPPEVDCNASGRALSDRAALTCLQTAIAAGDAEAILTALKWVGNWERAHPLYHETQELLTSWSTMVLLSAQQNRARGHLAEAITLIESIPPVSPRYAEAQMLLKQFRDERKLNELLSYKEAQKALKQQDWAQAIASLWHLQASESTPSQASLSRRLAEQIDAERQAQRLLNQALQQYFLGHWQDQGNAIAIASQIDPDTYVWESAQPLLDGWSDELLSVGRDHIDQGNFAHAAAILKQVAHNPNRRIVAQDWLMRARAYHQVQTHLEASSAAPASDRSMDISASAAMLTAQGIQPETSQASPVHFG